MDRDQGIRVWPVKRFKKRISPCKRSINDSIAWIILRQNRLSILVTISEEEMPNIIMDELIVTFRIPENIPKMDAEAIRQKLTSDEFIHQLQQSIKNIMDMYAELRLAQLSIAR